MLETTDGQPRVVRRKFATPPVKLACLSCRRGGPRVRKKHAAPAPAPAPDDVDTNPGRSLLASVPIEEETLLPDAFQQPVALQNFIDPGAALGQLPDLGQDSDFLVDNLFANTFPDNDFGGMALPVPQKTGPLVRTYCSDRSLLQAYYCWVHPYIPIFPPPETYPPVDEPVPLAQNQLSGFGSPDDYEPYTPVALALSAVLALVPCAEDTDPSGPDSLLFRRKYAQFFAQSAVECIDAESEMADSTTEPHKALEASSASEPSPIDRPPFHPRVPVELESIIALDLLSVYEYAQRGNIKKMRLRAGQALMEAMMTHSLHAQPERDDDDSFAEAKRRVWWMTYICATQSSIVSNSPPPLELYGATFTTRLPTLDIDPEAWPVFIEAQQSILTATQFVIQLNKALASHGDMKPIYAKMIELENRFAPLVDKSEGWTLPGNLAPPVDPAETCLVRSLRSMARIKLNSARIKVHRYCAFYDLPVFNGKHCDLKSASERVAKGYELLPWSCSCGGALNANSLVSVHPPLVTPSIHSMASNVNPLVVHASASQSAASSSSVKAATASPESSTHSAYLSSSASPQTADTGLSSTPLTLMTKVSPPVSSTITPADLPPFSSHYSAKVCLRSAINIASGFDDLPYPNPSGRFGQDNCFLSPTSPIVAPRMLPSYTCCAMQGAYVFLSVYRKTIGLQTLSDGVVGAPEDASDVNVHVSAPLRGATDSGDYDYRLATLSIQLQRGLSSILTALENYGTAFEALQSMRDQIRYAAETLMGSGMRFSAV